MVGPEGRLYRQAYAAIDSAAAARGGAYSSARDNAQEQSHRNLDNSVNAALRGFDASQNASLSSQAAGLATIGSGIAGVRQEQAATLAATPVPVTPATPAAPAAPTTPKIKNPLILTAPDRPRPVKPMVSFMGHPSRAWL